MAEAGEDMTPEQATPEGSERCPTCGGTREGARDISSKLASPFLCRSSFHSTPDEQQGDSPADQMLRAIDEADEQQGGEGEALSAYREGGTVEPGDIIPPDQWEVVSDGKGGFGERRVEDALTPQEAVDRDSRARAAAIDRARGEWDRVASQLARAEAVLREIAALESVVPDFGDGRPGIVMRDEEMREKARSYFDTNPHPEEET